MSTTANQDVFDTLTPEERAAIGDTEYSEEELAAMKGIAGDDDDGEGGDGDDDGDDGDQNAAPQAPVNPQAAADQQASDPPAAASPAGAASSVQAAPATSPVYRAELPADYDAQVAEVNEETRALAQKFRAGEIEFEEFETRQAELLARRDALRDAKIKADISSEMGTQTAEQAWQSTVALFIDTQAAAGVDYRAKQELNRDLDLFVKALASDEANDDKPMAWFLEEAHKFVVAKHGLAVPPPPDPTPTSRKPPVDALPKTLAQVPGSDGPGDVGDEFADLDNLEGLELEDALRRMTPAQREKYAMAGR